MGGKELPKPVDGRSQDERERERGGKDETEERRRFRESLKSDNGREKEMDVQITRVQTQCVYTANSLEI